MSQLSISHLKTNLANQIFFRRVSLLINKPFKELVTQLISQTVSISLLVDFEMSAVLVSHNSHHFAVFSLSARSKNSFSNVKLMSEVNCSKSSNIYLICSRSSLKRLKDINKNAISMRWIIAKVSQKLFFKVHLLSSHLLISRHPVQESKFSACAVTGYCSRWLFHRSEYRSPWYR